MKKAEREKLLEHVIQIMETKMKESGITAKVEGRSKHFTSIYNKMVIQQKTFDEIFDLMAIRVLIQHREGMLRGAGNGPHHLEASPGPFQGLCGDA